MVCGSICTIINKSLENSAVMNSEESYRTQQLAFQDLKTFSNELIKIIDVINSTVKCNDCLATILNATVVEDGHRPISGRGLYPQMVSH